jgi:hypothetical protein
VFVFSIFCSLFVSCYRNKQPTVCFPLRPPTRNQICINATEITFDQNTTTQPSFNEIVDISGNNAPIENESLACGVSVNSEQVGAWYTLIGDGRCYSAEIAGTGSSLDAVLLVFNGTSCDTGDFWFLFETDVFLEITVTVSSCVGK